jgi:CheY-like chemotaxis protein
LGKGTTFTFCIGFEKAEMIAEVKAETKVPQFSNIRILIVEDNKINQLVTQKIMDKHQIQCDMVADGFDALKILETRTYDAILMDINMPGMNGYETTKRLRAMGVKSPVIALTAFDKEEVKAEVFASGMNDIMIKPFEPNQLFEVIQNQLEKVD